jgi:hypothetical protein
VLRFRFVAESARAVRWRCVLDGHCRHAGGRLVNSLDIKPRNVSEGLP